MASLPDELWRRILQIGVETRGVGFKDLCCVAISCSCLRRLSGDDCLWSTLLSSDFKPPNLDIPASKRLYKLRFERERERKLAAHRRSVLRKESQVYEHSRKIRELEYCLIEESDKLRSTNSELSNLQMVRQASVALNVWQPEVIRGRHKQMVEQNVVPIESRVQALEMERRLCNQNLLGFNRAYEDEKQRLLIAQEELNSLKYHPLRPNCARDEQESNVKAKKSRRLARSDVKNKG